MGFYIHGPAHGKTEHLLSEYPEAEFEEIDLLEATDLAMAEDPKWGVIVVVDNGGFEAAGFTYNQHEFAAFTQRDDLRPRRYLKGDRRVIEQLTRFPARHDREWAQLMRRDRYDPSTWEVS